MSTWKGLCERADKVPDDEPQCFQIMSMYVKDFDKIRAVVEAAKDVASPDEDVSFGKILWLHDALKDLGAIEYTDGEGL